MSQTSSRLASTWLEFEGSFVSFVIILYSCLPPSSSRHKDISISSEANCFVPTQDDNKIREEEQREGIKEPKTRLFDKNLKKDIRFSICSAGKPLPGIFKICVSHFPWSHCLPLSLYLSFQRTETGCRQEQQNISCCKIAFFKPSTEQEEEEDSGREEMVSPETPSFSDEAFQTPLMLKSVVCIIQTSLLFLTKWKEFTGWQQRV